MAAKLTPHEAILYGMVSMSAVDRNMSDTELARIGALVRNLPVFEGFDPDQVIKTCRECAESLSGDDGLNETLTAIDAGLPNKLKETAYALAVEVAAADLDVKAEELRFLALLRDRLGLDKLTTAAIERGASARHQTV